MTDDADRLAGFIAAHPRLFVLTGAGVSTGSGIPDYRDRDGEWKRARPVEHRAFLDDPAVYRRYWARGFVGWGWFGAATPNAAHHALAALEARGHVGLLVTQNVDRLHQRAGSARVVDLHGRLDRVVCVDCGDAMDRDALQPVMAAANAGWSPRADGAAPDGDADIDDAAIARFLPPRCTQCGGRLKPDVVFFGDNVPRARVDQATAALDAADAMLVAGSSLMVWSGFRFARAAHAAGKPLAIANLGHTRADDLATLKLDADCGGLLPAAVERLPAQPAVVAAAAAGGAGASVENSGR